MLLMHLGAGIDYPVEHLMTPATVPQTGYSGQDPHPRADSSHALGRVQLDKHGAWARARAATHRNAYQRTPV